MKPSILLLAASLTSTFGSPLLPAPTSIPNFSNLAGNALLSRSNGTAPGRFSLPIKQHSKERRKTKRDETSSIADLTIMEYLMDFQRMLESVLRLSSLSI